MKEWISPEIELLPINQTLAICNIPGKLEGTGDVDNIADCAATS